MRPGEVGADGRRRHAGSVEQLIWEHEPTQTLRSPILVTAWDGLFDVGGAATTEVRVVPGDNLWKIARQHNTTVAALMALNGLPHDRLQVGQTLTVVPGPSLGAVSAAAAGEE